MSNNLRRGLFPKNMSTTMRAIVLQAIQTLHNLTSVGPMGIPKIDDDFGQHYDND